MQSAKYVYIGIYVLAFLPLAYLLGKELFRLRRDRAKASRPKLILYPVSLVLLTALVWWMYSFTLQTQPLLVAEKEARAVLVGEDTTAWEGCQLQMPQQSIEDGPYRVYNVMLENEDEEKLVVQITLNNGNPGNQPVLIDSQVFRGEEADEIVGRAMYFDVGIYEKP